LFIFIAVSFNVEIAYAKESGRLKQKVMVRQGMEKISNFYLVAFLCLVVSGSGAGHALAHELDTPGEQETPHFAAETRSGREQPGKPREEPTIWAARHKKEGLPASSCRLSPAQQYAGEMLSYLLKLVLGQEGNPDSRGEWRTTGLDASLELENFYQALTDPEKQVHELVVLDPNILDISGVLYHYDPSLSSTKGRLGIFGLYPAPEFIAIRLLLLRKIHRGEKVRLEALVEREALLFNREIEPSEKDYKATNLSVDEMALIRDIFAREPHLYNYLICPFLVKALYEVGVVARDDYVDKKVAEARYRGYGCRRFSRSKRGDAVKIALLPSFLENFEYGEALTPFSRFGFRATGYFDEAVSKTRDKILEQAEVLLQRKLNEGRSAKDKVDGFEWEALWEGIAREKLGFYVQDQSPLVIYPANAEEVIQDVCPEADFVVIILGKNVYLALHIDKEKDIYPAVNRIFVDISDIEYSQIQEECEQIAEVIYSTIKDDLEEIMRKAF
jgi:hypothetical protein